MIDCGLLETIYFRIRVYKFLLKFWQWQDWYWDIAIVVVTIHYLNHVLDTNNNSLLYKIYNLEAMSASDMVYCAS